MPPAEPFPPDLHLQKVAGILFCWAGEPGDAEEALAPARALDPALDGVQPMPLAALNAAFDPIYPAGDQWYWRSHILTGISDEAIAANMEFAQTLPTWKCTTHFYPIDGAAARVDRDATAWPNRDGGWVQVIVGVDADPANAELVTDWARSYSESLQPHTAGGGYVNMMMDEGEDRVRAIYGANYDRLAEAKAQYDPDNLFHVNQNIKPV